MIQADILLYLGVSVLFGLALSRFKVPGGMMIGAVFGSTLVHLLSGGAPLPGPVKTLAQIVAGGYIGATVSRSELKRLPNMLTPFFIIIAGLFFINVLSARLILATGKMDFLTALFSTAPGGISDMPIIAADLNADASIVLVMQLARFVMGIAVFPMLIRLLTKANSAGAEQAKSGHHSAREARLLPALVPLAVAAVFGLIGKRLGIPAGTMSFATLGGMVTRLLYPKAGVPRAVRRGAQCLSGAYVGSGIGIAQLTRFPGLAVPVMILVAVYFAGCFILSRVLKHFRFFTDRESMLAVTPAGASDMALIAADLNVENVSVILVQVLRMVIVLTLFPSLLFRIAG